MSEPAQDVQSRARYLAMAQGTNAQVAAGLVVDFGLSMSAAQEFVGRMSEELQTMRWAGQMLAKERDYRLMLGEDLGKVNGSHLSAMDRFARAYLGLGEREEVAKLVEEAQRKLAKGAKPGLKVAG